MEAQALKISNRMLNFPCPDLFLIAKLFLKVICTGGVFWLLEWIQGARKKISYEQGFVVHHEELSLSH